MGLYINKILYKSWQPIKIARELTRSRLDLVGVQVSWERGRTEPQEVYTFPYQKVGENHYCETQTLVC